MASFRCKIADVIARVKYASNKSVQEIEFQYGRKLCNFMPTDGPSNNNRACSHTGPGLHFPLSFVLHLDFWLVNSNLFWNKLILSNSQRKTANKAEKVLLIHPQQIRSASHSAHIMSIQISARPNLIKCTVNHQCWGCDTQVHPRKQHPYRWLCTQSHWLRYNATAH